MLQVDMNASVRTVSGKGAARKLRSQGQIPAVVYGAGTDSISLVMNIREFTKNMFQINRRNAVIKLDVDDGGKVSTRHVMLKEVQVDPVMDSALHADFCDVSLEKDISLDVPVRFDGKARGVELGGEMFCAKNSVVLKGKVLDIPDEIVIDVSALEIGDSLTFGDLDIPSDMQIIDEPSRVLVGVAEAGIKIDEDEGEAEAEEPAAAEAETASA